MKSLKIFKKIFNPISNLSKKQRFYLMLGVIAFLLIAIPSFIYTISNSKKAEAAWFDGNWSYRQAMNITVSSSADDITNLQTVISIDTSTLVSTGKLQSSCQDLRFTSIDGTPLSYYLDSGCGTASTKVWVLVNKVPKNTTSYTMYMYYGNPSASTGSNSSLFTLYRGLTGYWSMNEGSGTTLTDVSGNGRDATLHGSTWISEKYNNSIDFADTQITDYIDVPYTALNGLTDYTVSFWAYQGVSGEYIFSGSNGSDHNYMLMKSPTTSGWHFYVWRRSGATGHIYQDLTVTDSLIYSVPTNPLTIASGGLIIGQEQDSLGGGFASDQSYSGKIDELRIYNRALSDSELSSLYNSNDSIMTASPSTVKPTISFGSEEKSPGPIAYWTFDEGSGTVAHDSSVNKNNGTLSGATWISGDQCLSGKCLYFDGNDNVQIPNSKSLQITEDGTWEMWVKTNLGFSRGGLIYKNYSYEYELIMESTGLIGVYHGDGTWEEINEPANAKARANEWTHVAVTRNNTTQTYTWYINGVAIGTDAYTRIPASSSSPVYIGSRGGSYYFVGYIDDVKIYNYERSSSQIQNDYNSRSSVKGVSSQIGENNQLSSALSNGLVGYWKMDEATWSGTFGDVVDSSGNGLTGTAGGAANAAAFATPSGKFGNAGYFDGVDDRVNVSDKDSLDSISDLTISVWFKVNSYYGYMPLIWKGGNYGLRANNDGSTMELVWWNGTQVYRMVPPRPSIGVWHHGVMVIKNNNISKWYVDGIDVSTTAFYWFDQARNISSPLTIGYDNAGKTFNGNLDEARIYNRALSSSEISALYNWAPGPIGYWDFEEGQGTTVYDKAGTPSGTLNNGTWSGTGTHWGQGKYGKAGKFNGSGNYVNTGSNAMLDLNNAMTYSFWIKGNTPQSSAWSSLLEKSNYGTSGWGCHVSNVGPSLYMRIDTSAGINQTTGSIPNVLDGNWHYIAWVLENGSKKGYKDGALVVNTTYNHGNGFDAPNNSLLIGNAFNGLVDEVRLYNYARTAGQIVEDMNASHPAGGSPVASQIGYWDFDEGYGTTANNLGNAGSSLKGTISGATWTNDGKFGKALFFDGNDSVSIPNVSLSNIIDDSTDYTLSAWVKTSTTGSSRTIIGSRNSDGMTFYLDGNNYIIHDMDDNLIQSNTALTRNAWNHVVVTYKGSDASHISSIYINGKLDKSAANYAHTIAIAELYIGYESRFNLYFNGMIDDVKIYNSVLTAEQIKLEYNQGKSLVLGSSSDTSNLTGGSVASNSASVAYCIPGDNATCSPPVAEWNFEETGGTTAYDSSGNGNNGTLGGGTANYQPAWTAGKIGNALKYDGTNDYIATNVDVYNLYTAGAFTIEAWSYDTLVSGYDTIISSFKSAPFEGFYLRRNTNGTTMDACIWNAGSSNCAYANIELNTWIHWTVTYSGGVLNLYKNGAYIAQDATASMSDPLNTILIGTNYANSENWNGKIDQVRIYNYARTPAQIAWDYNNGKPVGYWDFDECQGTTVYDLSGNNNHGTTTIGGTGTQTSAGTCQSSGTAWYNGASGKYNYSLNFDDSDDYVRINNIPVNTISGQYNTISYWMYWNGTITNTPIYMNNGAGGYYGIYIQSSSCMGFNVGAGDTYGINPTGLSNQWVHVAAIFYNGAYTGNNKLYINGVNRTLTQCSGSAQSGTARTTLYIGQTGTDNTYSYGGKIDDVRVYNYALTTGQVKNIMNQGSAVRWGPSTGAPN